MESSSPSPLSSSTDSDEVLSALVGRAAALIAAPEKKKGKAPGQARREIETLGALKDLDGSLGTIFVGQHPVPLYSLLPSSSVGLP